MLFKITLYDEYVFSFISRSHTASFVRTNLAVDPISLSLTHSKIRTELTVATRQVWSNMLVAVSIILIINDYQRSINPTWVLIRFTRMPSLFRCRSRGVSIPRANFSGWSNMLVEVLIVLDYQRSNRSTFVLIVVRFLYLKYTEPDRVFLSSCVIGVVTPSIF